MLNIYLFNYLFSLVVYGMLCMCVFSSGYLPNICTKCPSCNGEHEHWTTTTHTHTTIDSAILYCCHQITFVHTINISHPSNIRARVFAKYVLSANAAHVFWGIFCVLFLRCHHHACLKGYGSFDLPPCKLNIFWSLSHPARCLGRKLQLTVHSDYTHNFDFFLAVLSLQDFLF